MAAGRDGVAEQGLELPGGVYRVDLPRTDLKVALDGVQNEPGLALGSWLAFKQMEQATSSSPTKR